MFVALLDTSVLWPSLQRDFLLSLAVEGLYRPLWSEAVLGELEEHEARKLMWRHRLDANSARVRAAVLVETMRAAFADAVVTGWEPLEGTYGLPDQDDEHIVAAAVVGGAGAIVTSNLRDFPRTAVPGHIDVLPPHEFAANTVSLAPLSARRAVDEIASRSGRHGGALTADDILELLVTRYQMDEAVEYLRR